MTNKNCSSSMHTSFLRGLLSFSQKSHIWIQYFSRCPYFVTSEMRLHSRCSTNWIFFMCTRLASKVINFLAFQSMDLSTNAFLNDFRSFDRPTSKSFMFLLHNLQNSVIWVRAVGVFTFSLTFQTLVAVNLFSLSANWLVF